MMISDLERSKEIKCPTVMASEPVNIIESVPVSQVATAERVVRSPVEVLGRGEQ